MSPTGLPDSAVIPRLKLWQGGICAIRSALADLGERIMLLETAGHSMNAALSGSYDLRLVELSVVIAMCASYAALDLAGRVTASKSFSRRIWLIGGATAMGLGIWSMHYIEIGRAHV